MCILTSKKNLRETKEIHTLTDITWNGQSDRLRATWASCRLRWLSVSSRERVGQRRLHSLAWQGKTLDSWAVTSFPPIPSDSAQKHFPIGPSLHVALPWNVTSPLRNSQKWVLSSLCFSKSNLCAAKWLHHVVRTQAFVFAILLLHNKLPPNLVV